MNPVDRLNVLERELAEVKKQLTEPLVPTKAYYMGCQVYLLGANENVARSFNNTWLTQLTFLNQSMMDVT